MERGETIAGALVLDVEVDPSLAAYMAAAATRLGYTEPGIEITILDGLFRVNADAALDAHAIKRKLMHALYREKVRCESAPLRTKFLDILSGR